MLSDPSVNLALNKPASQITTHLGTDHASRAVDGNRDTVFLHKSCSHTHQATGPWWMVDLGRMVSVSKVYVVNRLDSAGGVNTDPFLGNVAVKIGELLSDDRTVDDRLKLRT